MSHLDSSAAKIVVIGAGPGGLTAAWRLSEHGILPTVFEADEEVGGLSRTWRRDKLLLDAGGHRFFTKIEGIDAIWRELLDDRDLLRRERRSAFLVAGNYHAYPLNPWEVIRSMPPLEALRCVASFTFARLRPRRTEHNFEGWALARFGQRLYRFMYKPYSEKVWGLPANQISADWASQRIWVPTGPAKLLLGILRGSRVPMQTIGTEFWYPRLGPGMLWDEMSSRVQARGSKVLCRHKVTRIYHEGGRAVGLIAETQGTRTAYEADHIISSMPLSALIMALDPPVPKDIRRAADALRYRNLLVVAFVVPDCVGFPYNWIYIPDSATRVGRIQNYYNWSPDMVPAGQNALGMEYFVANSDPLWKSTDDELTEIAKRELTALGIARGSEAQEGYVLRVPMAYPIYDQYYKDSVSRIRAWLEDFTPNIYPIGRNGMHKYNNQDHSMLTAMLTVENIFGAKYDVWSVNTRPDYHEERPAR